MGRLEDTDSSDNSFSFDDYSDRDSSHSFELIEEDSKSGLTTTRTQPYARAILRRLKVIEQENLSRFNNHSNEAIAFITERILKYWGYNWYELHPKLKYDDNLKLLKLGMNAIYGRQSIIISIEVGYYEHNPKFLTELGLSIYDPRGQQLTMVPNSTNIHIKIDDNKLLKNKDFLPNKSAYFNGKSTLLLNLDETINFVQALIDYYSSIENWPCCIVGHNLKSILAKLKFQEILIPDRLQKFDTKQLFLISGDKYTDTSLMNALKVVGVPYAHLRNAGNDAYYTFLLATKLCDPDSREYYRLDDWQPEIVTDGGPLNKRKFSDKSIIIECNALEAIDIVLRKET